LDTNVVLDVLVERHPWFSNSAALLSLVESGEAEAMVAAHTISTLHYLLSKELGRQRAAAALVDLVRLVRVAAVDHDIVVRALSLGWSDVEDAMQAVCAMEVDADVFVTRDPRDFASLPITVASPGEAYAQITSIDK
jgi:predicted nucleic acid-binding protein